MLTRCAQRASDILDGLRDGRTSMSATEQAEVVAGMCQERLRDAALREGGVIPPLSARLIGDAVAAELDEMEKVKKNKYQ